MEQYKNKECADDPTLRATESSSLPVISLPVMSVSHAECGRAELRKPGEIKEVLSRSEASLSMRGRKLHESGDSGMNKVNVAQIRFE